MKLNIIGEFKEAIIMFDHALEINPFSSYTYTNKGVKFISIIKGLP